MPSSRVRYRKRAAFLIFLGVLAFGRAEQKLLLAGSDTGSKTLQAVFSEQPPQLDGDLSDAVWQSAQPVSDFILEEPVEGGTPSEKTEVRVLYTDDALYLGFTCYDSEPDKITANERGWDFRPMAEDGIAIVLDPSHSHRDGYFFRANPLGAQWDALLTDQGNTRTIEWDGRWEVATRIHSWGWGLEVMIPFKTLHIPPSHEAIWGIDFKRFIRRRKENISWTNYRRDFAFREIAHSGHLLGISPRVRSQSLQVKPYASAGAVNIRDGSGTVQDRSLEAGLEDVRYTLTSTLNLNATLNPDFAQVDVDRVQVNLTRFPLFFPEKREFFLESAGLFDFGTGMQRGMGMQRDLRLLHTRRIGLTPDRRPIPILFGARLTGQTRKTQFGVMNVETRQHEDRSAQNFGIYRFKTNLWPRSYVGAMATQVAGVEGEDNLTGGLDADFVLLDNLRFQSFLARSGTAGPGGDGWAAVPFWLIWNSDLLLAEGQHMIIEDQFNAGVGFVSRTDVRRTTLNLQFSPRPGSEGIQQLHFRGGGSYWTDTGGRLLTRDLSTGAGLTLRPGENFNFNYTRNLEREEEPFLVAGRLPVPAGTYLSNQFAFRGQTYPGRKVSAFFNVAWEDFWDGTRRSVNLRPLIRWSDQFDTRLGYEIERVRLPSGSFTLRVLEATAHLNLNNQWLTRTTYQHNALEGEWGIHFRLNYVYRTGDDFFLVFSRTKTEGENSWAVLLKLTYTLDF